MSNNLCCDVNLLLNLFTTCFLLGTSLMRGTSEASHPLNRGLRQCSSAKEKRINIDEK